MALQGRGVVGGSGGRARPGSCGAEKEGDGRGQWAAWGEYKDARGMAVISHRPTDSDPCWREVLACDMSKSGNFILCLSLCW